MSLINKIRARCEALHNAGTNEPEDVYEQVAEEFNMDVEDLYDLLDSD